MAGASNINSFIDAILEGGKCGGLRGYKLAPKRMRPVEDFEQETLLLAQMASARNLVRSGAVFQRQFDVSMQLFERWNLEV